MKYTLLATLLLSSVSQAATTGTLLLQGVIQDTTSITVTLVGTSNTTLNLTAGETAKLVATASETSNNALGYKIFVSSTNAGQLINTVHTTAKTTYKLSYAGSTMTQPTTTPVQVKSVTVLNVLTTTSSNITVDVVALPSGLAGTYQDTVTVSIVAN